MSEVAVQQTDNSTEQIARELDSDFQFVADRLPTEVKTAYAGKSFLLSELEGIGRLTTTYLGKLCHGSDPLNNFVVRVTVEAEGYDGQLRFYKDFALTWASLRSEGPVIDKNPTQPHDLEGCPAPLGVLAFAVHSLRSEYARSYAVNLSQDNEVAQLDNYRS